MKLTILHDTLREGSFPINTVQKCGQDIKITVNKTDKVFEQEIVIELNEVEEDPIKTAYSFGKLVGIILANKNK